MRIFAIIIILIMHQGISGQGNFLSGNLQKKADKVLENTWKEKHIETRNLVFPVSGKHYEQYANRIQSVHIRSRHVGWVFYSSAQSRYERFFFMVVYDTDLMIKTVSVLEYNELFGAEITNRSWLKQFSGFPVSKTIHYKKDIDAISGATISAVNLLESVNRCSEFMLQLKQSGVLLPN